MSDKKYSYERFGSKGQRVGQAVTDILSRENVPQTVEETLEGMGERITEEINNIVEKNQYKFVSPFYIFVLTNKEMWAPNVLRNWYIPRQTAPKALDMVYEYPNHVKTLYKVDSKKGNFTILWNLPGIEDCKSILKNPQMHDPQLLSWIYDCFKGSLDSLETLVL